MARTSTNGSGEATTADLTQQIDTLRSDLAGLTEIIADMGKAQGERLSAAASERVDQAKAAGREVSDRALQQAELAKAQSSEFVRTQPATALGIAVGIGFLVGWMSGRK
jgi:ElaB/YqjD/DUF883 family membrane-anchored ribosome-binding protein